MQAHAHFQYPEKHMDKRFLGFTTAIGTAVLGATASTAAATAVGVGVTGLAAYGASKAFKGIIGGKDTTPSAGTAQAAQPSYDRASALAQQEQDKKRRGIARNKATYTTPSGLTPANQSNLNLKTLTGV
jgi:hypothetical protein